MAKHSRKRAQANGAGSSRTSSTAGGGYRSYTVHKQSAAPAILRDADATQKMMDYIGDGAAGKRGLARLARTCKAFCEPALNALWRELDSLVPLIGLFPSTLLRRAKRPGLGLAKEPVEEDWKKVLEYGERVESVRYVESFNNVSPSIFPVIEETRPREYILPNLKSLSWRVDTPAGLDRSLLFIHPRIEAVNLDIGIRITKIDDFIVKMTERTRLKEFSLVATGSTANLPDGFTDMMRSQMKLQKLTLSVPGTVSSAVGKWIASLPHLRSLQLDLSGRPNSAVEQFFSEMHAVQVGSGLSTPESVGAESGDDASVDFKDIRKSALRVVSSPLYARKIGPYSQLRELHLTGSAGGLAVFLRKLPMCEIVNLELVIEDPPEKGEWRQLLNSLCGRVGNALQSLKFSATGASKFPELVRSTSRGDVVGPTRRLPLEGLTTLPQVRRLEFDLPTSIIFTDEDVERLAIACPALEQLKLCPTARFPLSGEAPALTLEGVAALTTHCYYLHTLHAVINAAGASDAVLASRFVSSKSLLRLHFGHSWITDPLQAAICLSHIAPYLESLRWFHEKNRPGYIEVHAQGWQQTSDFLPHLQKLRLMERDAVPEDFELVPAREFAEKAVDARPITVNQEVFAEPETLNEGVQFCPACVEEAVQAETPLESVSVQAEPTLQSTYVDATLIFSDKESQGSPTLTHRSIDPESPTLPKPVLPMTDDLPTDKLSEAQSETTSDTSMSSDPGDVRHHPSYFPVSSIFHIFAAMRELFIAPPLLLSLWLMSRSLATIGATRIYTTQEVMHVDEEEEKEGHDSENPAAEGPLKEATDATMVTASEAVSPVCL
ncbi:hypothetical protein PUNSTDRAFT_58180 [Punctularia strigosozonata HHB-11173 SS5]|uniref:uncharacterized protein n=1 Tax=Punctularia strigosozonata (strain HHB-11173) TaxID=741275 RepID=UPI0004417CF2|nr:uncharacterized protein PUNSTDRAFT_58180 [Punctularia strigosozonata HHB-11173 SS5]EIN14042.1 hypothetical protein PUNSTDRAFT_58180 [Punctularia strigosozonata HHB-11173 SS5]